MKKILFFLFEFLLSLTLMTSCIKDYITEEHIHEYYEGSKVYAQEYTIKSRDWQKAEFSGRQYLYCSVDNADITKYVMDNNGAVLAYMWTQYNTDDYCWSPLPYVYPLVVDDKVIPENFRIEIEEGHVTFIVEDLDAKEVCGINEDTYFKVVVMVD